MSEKRIFGFSIFQLVVTNDGNGYRLNGIPISDEQDREIWDQSPDNPKNRLRDPAKETAND